ncbi:hypothetical protein BY458DRAFT_488134 [Sporodiniella umbellata]|nr:hypothetical protein BY458DRAFT_488134 [Sporodiniella umbellata]
MLFYLLSVVLVILCTFVKADQINIIEPPSLSVFRANDEINFAYSIRSMGMARVWGASVTLVQTDNNKSIEGFPSLDYSANDEKEISDKWTIPSTIANGTYTFCVAANVSYPCSQSNNGKGPFKQCQDMIYKNATFTILNS